MLVFLRCAVIILNLCLWLPSVFCAPCCVDIEEAEKKYLAANQYNEFIGFLDNFKDKDKINPPCLDYYKANTRYLQLKYLEEKQSWDDYFANGNTYREQLEQNARKVISQTDNSNCLRPKSRLLLWQFHRGQQDALAQAALDDLIADVNLYAKEAGDTELIKNIADSLSAYEEKTKARQIYKLYAGQLAAGKITNSEIKNAASAFCKEGNLELAQAVFDIYIEKISKILEPGKFIKELFEIASLFVYKPQGNGLASNGQSHKPKGNGLASNGQSHKPKGNGLASNGQSHKPAGLYDMAYAEKIYAMIERLGQKNAFNQETIYLRAFNLEKFKDYKEAGKLYEQLIQLYPETKYFDQAVYKIAMINAYASANIAEARKYFNMLVAKTVFTPLEVSTKGAAVTSGDLLLTGFSPHVIYSFYQLGLLSQWEGDLVKAKEYYELLLKNSADNYVEIAARSKERIGEIQENKQLDYNLKIFLDLSLKSENSLSEMGRAELKSSSYALEKGEKAEISSFVNMPESGCNQVQLQYLWSGDLGGAAVGVTDSSFQCAYFDIGTKAINIVIISPAGFIDRSFIMVDAY